MFICKLTQTCMAAQGWPCNLCIGVGGSVLAGARRRRLHELPWHPTTKRLHP